MSFWYLQFSQKTNEKNIKMYHDKTKGQLISKCSFGIFKSPKKGTKKIDFTTMVPQVKLFSFFFWENWRHQKDILKLTDLYRMPRTLCLKWLKTKWDTILNIYKKIVFYHGAQGIKHNLGWSPMDAILMILDLWLYIHGKHFSKLYIFLQKAICLLFSIENKPKPYLITLQESC